MKSFVTILLVYIHLIAFTVSTNNTFLHLKTYSIIWIPILAAAAAIVATLAVAAPASTARAAQKRNESQKIVLQLRKQYLMQK